VDEMTGSEPVDRRPPARSPTPPQRATVEDVAGAAIAVVAVTVALTRYALAVALRAPLEMLRALGRVGRGLPGAWHASALAHPGSVVVRQLGAWADRLTPMAARAVLSRLDVAALVREFVDLDDLAGGLDVNRVAARVDVAPLIDRVDIDAIAAGLDLDALVEKVDIARVLDRVDLDAVVARVDLDRAVERVDIARVLDRVDLDAVVARVDLDRAVERVDLERIIARVDPDAVVARVDFDGAVDRVDIDRVIARTDVVGLARYVIQEIDLPAILRYSTESATSEVVRGVRHQGAEADRAVERVVDRLLRRAARPATETGHDGS
jgi:hypothetical protein